MGRTITCTFQVNVNLSNGTQSVYGAMSFKQAKGCMETEKQYQNPKGIQVVNAEIWPQTAKGRNQIVKDYAIMDSQGKIEHYKIGQPVPFYTF